MLPRTAVISTLIVLALVGGALVYIERVNAPSAAAAQIISGMTIEVADTEAAQAHGLGGRASIPHDYGMLFVFAQKSLPGFWMKDMQVPIDIIWLADDGTILGIEAAVDPESYPKVFYPPAPVHYVLETRAGEAARKGWKPGTTIPFDRSQI